MQTFERRATQVVGILLLLGLLGFAGMRVFSGDDGGGRPRAKATAVADTADELPGPRTIPDALETGVASAPTAASAIGAMPDAAPPAPAVVPAQAVTHPAPPANPHTSKPPPSTPARGTNNGQGHDGDSAPAHQGGNPNEDGEHGNGHAGGGGKPR
jgi:hypothetical protein